MIAAAGAGGIVRLFISGLWHLGCVTAASMAQYHDVVGHDTDRDVVASLDTGALEANAT